MSMSLQKWLNQLRYHLLCGLTGSEESLLGGNLDPPRQKWHFEGIIIGHAKTCPQSIFSSARNSSGAASGYQYFRNLSLLGEVGVWKKLVHGLETTMKPIKSSHEYCVVTGTSLHVKSIIH